MHQVAPYSTASHSYYCSATISPARISAIAAAVVHGLYSLSYTFSFLWLEVMQLLVDFSISQWSSSGYNTELIVLYVTSVFVALHRVWHVFYSWIILPLSRCSIFICFSIYLWLRPHLKLLSSSPFCYILSCAFLKEIRNIIFSIFSILSFYICWSDITLVSFHFWSIFIKPFLGNHFRLPIQQKHWCKIWHW